MKTFDNEFRWSEKYRPQTIDECILPSEYKAMFKKIVADGEVPDMILAGASGLGKTTVAMALMNEMELDYLKLNSSLFGNIDTLRNEVAEFASSMSFSGNGRRKYVIFDEGDHLNPQSTQPALRNFMDEFSANCGFILTCNWLNRIIEPVQGRFSTINFTIPREERADLMKQFLKRIMNILDNENVTYEPKVLAVLVKNRFPNFRKIINELQTASKRGPIDTRLLAQFEADYSALVEILKAKKYEQMCKWVADNGGVDMAILTAELYRELRERVTPQSRPQLVYILNTYDYRSAFAVNADLNTTAMFQELMADLEWQ